MHPNKNHPPERKRRHIVATVTDLGSRLGCIGQTLKISGPKKDRLIQTKTILTIIFIRDSALDLVVKEDVKKEFYLKQIKQKKYIFLFK